MPWKASSVMDERMKFMLFTGTHGQSRDVRSADAATPFGESEFTMTDGVGSAASSQSTYFKFFSDQASVTFIQVHVTFDDCRLNLVSVDTAHHS